MLNLCYRYVFFFPFSKRVNDVNPYKGLFGKLLVMHVCTLVLECTIFPFPILPLFQCLQPLK